MYYTNKNIHPHFVESLKQDKLTDDAIDILIGIGERINKIYKSNYMLETNLYGYLHLVKNWNKVQLDKNATYTYMTNIYKNGLRDGAVRAQRDKKNWNRKGFISKDDLYNEFGITDEIFNSVIELKRYGESNFFYFSYNTIYYERWKKMNTISSNDRLKKLIDLLDYCISYDISNKETFMIILKKNQGKFELHSI